MVKHQLWPAICRRVLAEQRPGVGVDVVAVEVALQRLAVPDAGVQVPAKCVDLTPLGIDAHLVAGASTRTILIGAQETCMIAQLFQLDFMHKTLEYVEFSFPQIFSSDIYE